MLHVLCMMSKVICLIFVLLVGVACGQGGTKYDLDSLNGKVRTGMSELEVTRDAGPPTHIDVKDDTRTLRYEAKEGSGALVVTMKQNVVINVERKN